MYELTTLLLDIITIGLVAAISPTTFAVLIVLLSLSKRPKTSGAGFLAGSFIVVLLAGILGFLAAGSVVYLTKSDPGPVRGWVNVILGAVVLYYGGNIIFNKKELFETMEISDKPSKSPRSEFMSNMVLAMGMFALNFITTALVFLGASKIALAQVDFMGKIISMVVLLAITLSLVEIPLLIYVFRPQKANKILYKLNQWIKKNGYYLSAALILIIGIYLLYNGLNILKWI